MPARPPQAVGVRVDGVKQRGVAVQAELVHRGAGGVHVPELGRVVEEGRPDERGVRRDERGPVAEERRVDGDGGADGIGVVQQDRDDRRVVWSFVAGISPELVPA